MSDLALVIADGCIDLKVGSTTLERDGGLETAVLISLFTDQRSFVSDSEERRGWWGDIFSETPGDQIGSKLWLLDRSKILASSEVAFETRAKQALQWLIDDGVAKSVDVTAAASGNEIKLEINIVQPDDPGRSRFAFFWDGQKVKRA